MESDTARPYKVLLACTGSVASVKVPHLVAEIVKTAPPDRSVEVRIAATNHSLHFFEPDDCPELRGVRLYRDSDEWSGPAGQPWRMGDPILHIELRRWADVMVVAPLDANTLAKMAGGLCDNLVTCVARAWPIGALSGGGKPLLVCPAMNTCMWDHPLTARHLETMHQFGYHQVAPVSKKLACGDLGMGAMAEVGEIARRTWELLQMDNGTPSAIDKSSS